MMDDNDAVVGGLTANVKKMGVGDEHLEKDLDNNYPEMNVSQGDEEGEGAATTSVIDAAPRRDFSSKRNSEKKPTSEMKEKVEESHEYNMDHRKRGFAIIINNKEFDQQTGMNRREGTDRDADRLSHIFSIMGFEVKQYNNLSCRKMIGVLQLASRENHSDSDCIAVAMLSHGDDGVIYGTDGTVPVQELVDLLKGDKCRGLVGKPKLFFIQACRGTEFDDGVMQTIAKDMTDSDGFYQRRIPVEADVLVAYSVTPGKYAWRNPQKGSWFVQALYEVLTQYGQEMEILHLLTRVNRKVALDFESNTTREWMSHKKQVPCFVSMLTKEVYFRPKGHGNSKGHGHDGSPVSRCASRASPKGLSNSGTPV